MSILKSRFSRIFITLALLGVICFVMGIYEIVGASAFKSDINKNIDNSENIINYMYQSDYKLKENVCGDILYLYEAYCEETTTHTVNGIETSSNVSGTYYLMPIVNYEDGDDNTYYITVVARDSEFRQSCEMLVDDTYDFLWGEEDIDWTDCVFYGKVKPLEDDVKAYLKEFVNEIELFENASDYDKYILPFQLEDYNYNRHMKSGGFLLVIGIVLIAVSAVIYIVYKKKSAANAEASFNEDIEPVKEASFNTNPIDEKTVSAFEPREQAANNVEPVAVKEEKAQERKEPEAAASTAAGEMLTANVSADDLDKLPEDGASRPAFNYDNDGMGGIDVTELDLSTLGEYSEEKPSENDDNLYTDDYDEDYTFDADPSSIQLSEMDN